MIPVTLNNVYLHSLEWFFDFVEKFYHYIMSFKKEQVFSENSEVKNKYKLIKSKPFKSYKIIKNKRETKTE